MRRTHVRAAFAEHARALSPNACVWSEARALPWLLAEQMDALSKAIYSHLANKVAIKSAMGNNAARLFVPPAQHVDLDVTFGKLYENPNVKHFVQRLYPGRSEPDVFSHIFTSDVGKLLGQLAAVFAKQNNVRTSISDLVLNALRNLAAGNVTEQELDWFVQQVAQMRQTIKN